MSTLTLAVARLVVSGALENKYDRFGDAEFERTISEVWHATEHVSDEEDLICLLRPADDFPTDIMNHVVVLRLIESFWRFRSGMKNPIRHMHQAIYGVPNNPPMMRTTEYIADFDGAIPTPVGDAKGALAELELEVERLASVFRSQAVASQAIFLAHLFSSIIRIHPFEDGNGRAARMTVQYCLRSWGQPYLPLPKVRNVPTWHDALEKAVAGDQRALVQEFTGRMIGNNSDTKGRPQAPQ